MKQGLEDEMIAAARSKSWKELRFSGALGRASGGEWGC